MDSAELDNAISELETRVDRLRALYEQYFLGIERLEPLVPRKDVDRRIWQLRREKIRNTAKRFKLQTIIQRYNTLQQYWQRICREIERGTYRRHVLRAERATTTVSDIVAQKEAEKRQAEARTTADDLADMLARDVDAEQEFARAVAEASGPPSPPPAPWTPQPPPRTSQPLEALDLELDGIPRTSPPPPVTSAAPANPGARASAPEPRGNLLAALGVRQGSSRGNVGSLVGPTPVRTGKLRPRATGDTSALVPSAPIQASPAAPTPDNAARRTVLSAPGPRPAAAAPTAARPATSAAPTVARPAASAPTVTRPVPPASPAPSAAPSAPAAQAPAARPSPQAAAASNAREHVVPRPNPAAGAQGLTDQRILELHRELVAAKQRIRETGKVSVDGLAKSLRAAESKLKAQHKDRRIDFDIIIKNGKAVVKPIVR